MKRFNDYNDAELLGIDNETLNIAIRVEAIQRGITPPIPLSEALRSSEWKGYTLPGDNAVVYRITVGYNRSAYAYTDRKDAENALKGIVSLHEHGYPVKKMSIQYETPTIEEVRISASDSQQKAAKFEEFTQDNSEFDKVVEECMERYSRVRQDDYNKKVLNEKKAEYLRLSGGNVEIAKAFWEKGRNGTWPE